MGKEEESYLVKYVHSGKEVKVAPSRMLPVNLPEEDCLPENNTKMTTKTTTATTTTTTNLKKTNLRTTTSTAIAMTAATANTAIATATATTISSPTKKLNKALEEHTQQLKLGVLQLHAEYQRMQNVQNQNQPLELAVKDDAFNGNVIDENFFDNSPFEDMFTSFSHSIEPEPRAEGGQKLKQGPFANTFSGSGALSGGRSAAGSSSVKTSRKNSKKPTSKLNRAASLRGMRTPVKTVKKTSRTVKNASASRDKTGSLWQSLAKGVRGSSKKKAKASPALRYMVNSPRNNDTINSKQEIGFSQLQF